MLLPLPLPLLVGAAGSRYSLNTPARPRHCSKLVSQPPQLGERRCVIWRRWGHLEVTLPFQVMHGKGYCLSKKRHGGQERPPATAEEANRSIVRWNNHKRFTSYNAAGAKKKIDELTGNTRLSALVERVVTAAEGEPNSALLDDIAALYRELPEAFRFPALDLLSHLLAVTVHPFGWLQLLLSDDGNGGDAPNARAFFEECIQNLPHVPDVEALVTTRLFAHVIAALDKPPPGAKLTADQLALILAMLTKAPQSLLQTKNSNVKTAICALLQNAAVLLAGDPVVLGKDGASDATRGVMRLLAQLLLFESISSSHTRDLVATVMTLMLSDGSGKDIQTSVVAVEVGRNTLAHTLRALKAGPEPHCREAAIKLLHCLDDAELQ
ncbi:hypothetical protein TcG_05546 [Trypanosoma cruzi]|nr:hypothetical protein TcG_05546 [Trypanosoma cruzi]